MSPRWIRPSAAAGLLAALTVGVAAPAALACSCVPPSAATVNRADVVFTGTVTARSDPNAGQPMYSTADPITYAIAVDGELKGDVDATAQVVTARDGSSCGVHFEVGQRYLVIADLEDGTLRTGLCQGTQALPAGAPLPEFAQGLTPAEPTAAWPSPERVSRPAAGTQSPSVAIGPGGTATVIWTRTTYVPELRETIETSRLFAAGSSATGAFDEAALISAEDELAFGATVAAAGDTHVVTWLGVRRGSTTTAAITARARPLGGAWGPPEVLEIDADPPGLRVPSIAGNAAGQALAVWLSDAGLRAAAYTSAGGWAPPVTIAPDAPEQPVGVAFGQDGTAAVSWWHREAEGLVARAALRTAAGAWSQPMTVSEALEVDDRVVPYEPPHVSAAAGEALVVWIAPERTTRGAVHAARVAPDGIRGTWRLSAGGGAREPQGGLDAAGRATVIWSESTGRDFRLRWAGQDPGGVWGATRAIAATTSPCEARLAARLAVSPAGRAQAIWMEFARRGEVIVASERPVGGDFSRPRAISRAGASVGALAVSDDGAVAAWSRAPLGARGRPFIEAAVQGSAGPGGSGLREVVAPRLADVRMPGEIALRGRLPIRFDLSRPARVEVRFERVRPGVRFIGPVRRGARAGGNEIVVPTWSTPGRRLGPGVYEVHVQAVTAERASCTITRRLVVRR